MKNLFKSKLNSTKAVVIQLSDKLIDEIRNQHLAMSLKIKAGVKRFKREVKLTRKVRIPRLNRKIVAFTNAKKFR